MAVLALDIGTTKICALVVDETSGAVLEQRGADNAFLPAAHPWDRQQDPDRIFEIIEGLIAELTKRFGNFLCIGITGQMHGILYLDISGKAVGPLYTWQDQSAALPRGDGKSYAASLADLSPGPIAPGYGLATCFYHLVNKQIPQGAVKICTIGDYIALRLCAAPASQLLMHTTNAGGLGFFDLSRSEFDIKALETADIVPSLLPKVVCSAEILGKTAGGCPVCVAIADNQASFLGAVRDSPESILVNIGTGSQISLVSARAHNPGGMETRPFFDGQFLLAGASLCGGRSYAILEGFFREVIKIAGLSAERPLYDVMDALAIRFIEGADGRAAESLTVDTRFAGTRNQPSVRGSIERISEDNFTPAGLAAGFLSGIAGELYHFYQPVMDEGAGNYKWLIGAGNGIRRNTPLKRILAKQFNMPLEIPLYQEEAAYGAALFALTGIGYFKNLDEARQLIRYETAGNEKGGAF
jgi:sedoheptulokinase